MCVQYCFLVLLYAAAVYNNHYLSEGTTGILRFVYRLCLMNFEFICPVPHQFSTVYPFDTFYQGCDVRFAVDGHDVLPPAILSVPSGCTLGRLETLAGLVSAKLWGCSFHIASLHCTVILEQPALCTHGVEGFFSSPSNGKDKRSDDHHFGSA
jgi:hypothetical protein